MKQESIQTLKDFIQNQELELEEQLKKNAETQETMQQFLKEQQIILHNLRETSTRIELDNHDKNVELARINGEISSTNNDLKMMKNELQVTTDPPYIISPLDSC